MSWDRLEAAAWLASAASSRSDEEIAAGNDERRKAVLMQAGTGDSEVGRVMVGRRVGSGVRGGGGGSACIWLLKLRGGDTRYLCTVFYVLFINKTQTKPIKGQDDPQPANRLDKNELTNQTKQKKVRDK